MAGAIGNVQLIDVFSRDIRFFGIVSDHLQNCGDRIVDMARISK
jgi:hypothetical protein